MAPNRQLPAPISVYHRVLNSFAIAANAPGTGETGTWRLLAGPNIPDFSITANSQTVTSAVNGNYTFEWRLNKGGCIATRDTVKITISPPTTPPLPLPVRHCKPFAAICPILLTGNAPANTETGRWTQVGGLGGAVITTPNLRITTVTGLTTAPTNSGGRYQTMPARAHLPKSPIA